MSRIEPNSLNPRGRGAFGATSNIPENAVSLPLDRSRAILQHARAITARVAITRSVLDRGAFSLHHDPPSPSLVLLSPPLASAHPRLISPTASRRCREASLLPTLAALTARRVGQGAPLRDNSGVLETVAFTQGGRMARLGSPHTQWRSQGQGGQRRPPQGVLGAVTAPISPPTFLECPRLAAAARSGSPTGPRSPQ